MKIHLPGSIVIVEWIDAEARDEWQDLDRRLEEHRDLTIIKTVGIVLEHTEEYIVVARSYHERDRGCEGTFQILAGMVRKIKKLTHPLIEIKKA